MLRECDRLVRLRASSARRRSAKGRDAQQKNECQSFHGRKRAGRGAPLAPRASVGWTVSGGGRGRRTRAAGFRRIDVPAVAPAVRERNVREHLLVRMII